MLIRKVISLCCRLLCEKLKKIQETICGIQWRVVEFPTGIPEEGKEIVMSPCNRAQPQKLSWLSHSDGSCISSNGFCSITVSDSMMHAWLLCRLRLCSINGDMNLVWGRLLYCC